MQGEVKMSDEEWFKLAENHKSAKEFGQAISCWEAISKNSSSINVSSHRYSISVRRKAERELGVACALGRGIAKNIDTAIQHLTNAARNLHPINHKEGDPLPMVFPRAEAELGVCYYIKNDKGNARKCFERASEKRESFDRWGTTQDADIISILWKCFLDGDSNVDPYPDLDYFSKYALNSGVCLLGSLNPNPPILGSQEEDYAAYRDLNKFNEINARINSALRDIAARLDASVRKGELLDLDMLECSREVLLFLEKHESSSSKVILAFYEKEMNNVDAFIKYMKEAVKQGDDIAEYHLEHETGAYFVLRRGIIEGCNTLRTLTKDAKIHSYCNGIERLVPFREKPPSNEEKNINYRQLAIIIAINFDRLNGFDPSKRDDALGFMMVNIRNWLVHDSLLNNFDEKSCAFIFLMTLRLRPDLNICINELYDHEKTLCKLFKKQEDLSKINSELISHYKKIIEIWNFIKYKPPEKISNSTRKFFDSEHYNVIANNIHEYGYKEIDYRSIMFCMFFLCGKYKITMYRDSYSILKLNGATWLQDFEKHFYPLIIENDANDNPANQYP